MAEEMAKITKASAAAKVRAEEQGTDLKKSEGSITDGDAFGDALGKGIL